MIKVTNVVQFKRRTNLLSYYEALERNGNCWMDKEAMRKYYEKERDVTLLLVFGRAKDGSHVAKIKCPINPLPIIGEFGYTSVQGVVALIKSLGWEVDARSDIGCSSFHILVNEVEKSKENWEKGKKENL